MKKIFLTGIASCAVFLSGCVSMILAQYKEIQPCNFEISEPYQGDFVMLQPDETLKANIIGKWVCESSTKAFCKVDLNNEPFMYKNIPDGKNVSTYEFKSDGTLNGEVITENFNAQTNKVDIKKTTQSGTWECKNGIFTLSFVNEKNNKVYSVPAVAFWKNQENMEFRYDTDSFEKMVNETIAQDAKMPANSSFDGYKAYYDKKGNFYNIVKTSSTSGGMHVKSEVIIKMPVQIYKRTK